MGSGSSKLSVSASRFTEMGVISFFITVFLSSFVRKIIPDTGNTDNQGRIHFREVVHVNIEKIMEVLISLLEEQEGVTIEYTIEKTA